MKMQIPQVLLSVKAYIKLRTYVNKADKEISGLGVVTKKDKILYIDDIYLLPQKVTAATTEMDKEGMAKFYDGLLQEGKDTSTIKLWWHSHVLMPVFWSPTDANTIKDFDTEQPQENWFLSIVTNKNAEMKCRLEIFQPFHITLDNLPWDVDFTDEIINDEVDKELSEKYIEEKVETPAITGEDIIIEEDDYWFRKNGIPFPIRPIL